MSLLKEVQRDVLERLGKVGVAARHAVESLLQGQHRSTLHGLSVEFATHRPYVPGDDLRRLDWLVYARTDRFDVKIFEEETRLRATIVLDCSGSMSYKSMPLDKLHYGRMLAAVLGFIMIRQADAVGMALVDTEIREHHPPGGTMGHLLNLFERLEATPPGGETSLAKVLNTLAGRLTRRGLVILISDLFDDADDLILALQHLRYRKQDVRVFEIVDPDEENFPFKGMWEFLGLEYEPRLKLDGDRVRTLYQETLAAHRQKVAEGCQANGIALERVRTDDDMALVIARALTGPWMRPGTGTRT